MLRFTAQVFMKYKQRNLSYFYIKYHLFSLYELNEVRCCIKIRMICNNNYMYIHYTNTYINAMVHQEMVAELVRSILERVEKK